MPRMTLIEMTQNILSAMSSDEVNSIDDTVESLQVAEIIRETYYEIQAGMNVPSRQGLIQLDPLSDPTKPNYMRIPTNVKNIEWVKYDYQTSGAVDYNWVTYREPLDFLALVKQTSGTYDTVVDTSGVSFYIRNDKNPEYWTTFDNEYLVFDSYDGALDTTLQNSKSLCWGQLDPVFDLNDSSVPDLDTDLFPLLLAEAKSVCFLNLKQISSPKEEQRSRRQKVRSQNDQWRLDQRKPYNKTPDYGRRRR